MEREEVLSQILLDGYIKTVKRKWKARPKGAKGALRFIVGIIGFTVGYAALRSAVAVQETMLDIQGWLASRGETQKEKEKHPPEA